MADRPSAARLLRLWASKQREGLILSSLVVAVVVMGGRVPVGIYGLGVFAGCITALQALGLVLVYRANRIINFAQIPMGAAAGLIFAALVRERAFLRLLQSVCEPCLPAPANPQAFLDSHPAVAASLPPAATPADIAVQLAPAVLVQANYWIAMASAAIAVMILVTVLYFALIRRFTASPRLVLTIVTIAVGELVLIIPAIAFGQLFHAGNGGARGVAGAKAMQVPVNLAFSWGGASFSSADVIGAGALIIAAIALWAFLRFSALGVALRAASENAERAGTIGIDVSQVGFRAWLMAATLSIVASLLEASNGQSSAVDYTPLVLGLTGALAGGLISLPWAAAGGVAVGVLAEALSYHPQTHGFLPVLLLGLVVLMLLAHRARSGRADREGARSWAASREVRPTPKELRGLPAVRNARIVMVSAGVILLGAYPWVMSAGQVTSGTATLAGCMIGLSLLVLTGWAGQISLGQIAFSAIGAWVAAASGWPMLLAILAGGVAGAGAAALVGIPALRLRGLHLAVSTLALGVVAEQVLLGPRYLGARLPSLLDRPVLLGTDFGDDRAFFYLTLLVLALTVIGVMGLRRSRFARALIASKDNELAAQSLGINLLRARLSAFAISGFIAATAGGLLAFAQHGVQQQTFSAAQGVDMFLYAVIGGLGSLTGPILGVGWFGLTTILSGGPLGYFLQYFASPGIGVLAVLLMFPGGLSQLWFGLRDAWLRRLADRHRIIVPSLYADRAVDPDARLPIAPKVSPSGGAAFVPLRYRLDLQWMTRPGRNLNRDA